PEELAYWTQMPQYMLPKAKADHERKLAVPLVQRTMQTLRSHLEHPANQGKNFAIERVLFDDQREFIFERHVTRKFYDRFSANLAEELKPLRDAYQDTNWGF